MRRILHVIPGLTGGGAERQLTILATLQADRGNSVHIAVLRPEFPTELQAAGVQLHEWRAANNHDPLMFWRIRNIMRAARPDVVQTWLTLPDVVAGSVALIRGIPWVLSERSDAEMYPPTWKNRARAWLARRSRAIVANSEGGASYWVSRGIPAGRIAVIPNAVSVPPATQAESVSLPPTFRGRPLVLFAGRLSAEKNPLLLIDALARAFATADAVALLCGTGPLESEAAERIRSHGMQERIVLAGHRPDVAALMRQARLCVAISVFEGNPNAVLEAMAVGCPLVVSDIQGYTRLVDNTSGRVVPLGDAAAIAAAIVEVLNDPAGAAERAARAKARLGDRSPDKLADAYDEVYRRITLGDSGPEKFATP